MERGLLPDPAMSTSNAAPLEHLAELGQSLAELMHDLRGPLTTIAGFADLMSIEADAEKRRDFFTEISRQVERLDRMTADTLAFARGDQPLLLRQVHLYDFGAELERLLARELGGTGISLHVELRYRGPARLDAPQLLRVAENLAHNSRQAMAGGKGTRFDVVIERRADDLVFSFTDDGPGVPPQVRARAFTAFTTAGKDGGTGLGLHVVEKIARAHGGSAVLRDTEQGTCVEVRVPWSAAQGGS